MTGLTLQTGLCLPGHNDSIHIHSGFGSYLSTLMQKWYWPELWFHLYLCIWLTQSYCLFVILHDKMTDCIYCWWISQILSSSSQMWVFLCEIRLIVRATTTWSILMTKIKASVNVFTNTQGDQWSAMQTWGELCCSALPAARSFFLLFPSGEWRVMCYQKTVRNHNNLKWQDFPC